MSAEINNTANVAVTADTNIRNQPAVNTASPVNPVSAEQPNPVQPLAATPTAEEASITPEQVNQSVNRINEFFQQQQSNLNFSVDEESDQLIVKVVDSETDEVIRQFPTEQAIELSKKLEEVIGLIFNDRA